MSIDIRYGRSHRNVYPSLNKRSVGGILSDVNVHNFSSRRIKARLNAVCEALGITYKEWFEMALLESEYDILTELLSSKPSDQSEWMWYAELCRFVRDSDAE